MKAKNDFIKKEVGNISSRFVYQTDLIRLGCYRNALIDELCYGCHPQHKTDKILKEIKVVDKFLGQNFIDLLNRNKLL